MADANVTELRPGPVNDPTNALRQRRHRKRKAQSTVPARMYGDMAVNTGYYTISYGNDGEQKLCRRATVSLTSRTAIDGSSPIIIRRPCRLPRNNSWLRSSAFFDYVLRGAIRAVGWAIDVAGGAARADVFSRGAIAYHILTGRPPVTNPFDLPSRLREGNGLLLSGTMSRAGLQLEEVVRMCADRSTAPPAALDHYNWRQHCRGLFQIPIAA